MIRNRVVIRCYNNRGPSGDQRKDDNKKKRREGDNQGMPHEDVDEDDTYLLVVDG